jgi:chorismate mutase
MIETHTHPKRAKSDSKQQITPNTLMKLLNKLKARDADITDQEVKKRIARLRAEISQTDSQIIEDIAERMRRADEIGRLKQEHNIPVLQITRWEHLLKDHMVKAKQLGLEKEFIKAVFELIHTHAVKRQL